MRADEAGESGQEALRGGRRHGGGGEGGAVKGGASEASVEAGGFWLEFRRLNALPLTHTQTF